MTGLRRLALPTLLALLAGFAALAWGLVALERTFVQERLDAFATIRGRQEALEQYARAAVTEALRKELAQRTDQLLAAEEDPLVPGADLLLVRDGRQILPRRPPPFATTAGASKVIALLEGQRIASDRDDPIGDRLDHFDRVRAALDADARDRIESTVRTFLEHRTLYRLPATQDVPITLALVLALGERTRPDEALVRAILVDGLSAGRAGEVDGLARSLLRHRGAFTEAEFTRLSSAILLAGSRAGISLEAFRTALEERDEPAETVRPETPIVLAEGRWYAEPHALGEVRGCRIDVAALVDGAADEMRSRGLFPDDRTALVLAPIGARVPVASLAVTLRSPSFERARQVADGRFRTKTALVFVCALFALGIVALAFFAQAQRQRFVQLKGDFVAAVSHELRTPLASIRLLAETLELRVAGHPGARDYPTRIVAEIERLTALVENILSFNRLENGRLAPRRTDVALADLAPAIAQEAARCARARVEVDTSGLGGVTMKADPELVTLLFTNLARNACLHNTRDPVRIQVAADAGKRVRVRFTDNGVGIPERERARVFDEFVRGSAAESGAVRGSGLGLSLCRRIMRAHGGGIRVASSSDEGTTFELDFPA